MKQKKFDFTCDPFGRAFVENKDKTISEQIAYGLLEASKYRPITFADNCMLPTVSPMPENGASFYTAGAGIGVDCAMYDRLAEANPEYEDDILAIKNYMYKVYTGYISKGKSHNG